MQANRKVILDKLPEEVSSFLLLTSISDKIVRQFLRRSLSTEVDVNLTDREGESGLLSFNSESQ